MPQDKTQQWETNREEIVSGLADWRVQHPKATLAQIEQEVDERLAGWRAQMIEDLAMSSQAAQSESSEVQERVCPHCSGRMQARGEHERSLSTVGGKKIRFHRSYLTCVDCGSRVFPPG